MTKIVNRVLPKINEFGFKLRHAMANGSEDFARELEARMKQDVPVDTGALQASIEVKYDPQSQRVTARAGQHYAGYVEFGTSMTPAQPYFYPNIEAMGGELGPRIRAELKKLR